MARRRRRERAIGTPATKAHRAPKRPRGQRARPSPSEPRLDELLEGVDIVLKIARKEFANLLVKTVNVGDQRQQAEQERESNAGADHCG